MIEYLCLKLKAWFPLNVSAIATNRSYLLARTLLRFAGFHSNHLFFCIWRHVNLVAHPVFNQKSRLFESSRYREASRVVVRPSNTCMETRLYT